MKNLFILAYTHRQLSVGDLGYLHISEENQQDRLNYLKQILQLEELMYLTTCNRVEFIFKTNQEVNDSFIISFLENLYPEIDDKVFKELCNQSECYQELNAIKHFLKVASSVDSMVIGEREIITQVRKAYNLCNSFGITGDSIRILIRYTIEMAKKIYTNTSISKKPVSVFSLAAELIEQNIPNKNPRIIIIGAGTTIKNMLRILSEKGYTNFQIFNRTLTKAKTLAEEYQAAAFPLENLVKVKNGFDILITCTGSEEPIITKKIYDKIVLDKSEDKIIVDLAIPQDIDSKIADKREVNYISMARLQELSKNNIKERTKEMVHAEKMIAEAAYEFRQISKQRDIELAMREVPNKVKEIKTNALEIVFSKEVSKLDSHSQETIEKILNYVEKKYISLPMKMAKDILLKKD